MKFRTRQQSVSSGSGLSGTIRIDRRTSSVLRRVKHGDIAVIDHLDLDRGNAEALLEHGVVAVVNASSFISGRYPNLGPEALAKAGIVLLDNVGAQVFNEIRDGASGRIEDGTLYVDGRAVAAGTELSLDVVQQQMDVAREGLTSQLQSFTHNTTEFLRREQELLLHGRGVPEVRAHISGRPVIVVVRDFDYVADLRLLKRFIREQKPVLIGVDGGADALLEAGLKPDVLMIGEGGLDTPSSASQGKAVTDKALSTAREVVLHADSADRIPGGERLEKLGIRPHKISASGSTEDIALLLADIKGATLIVTVGTHATLDEFLDSQRSGLASTFLTRLRVGPRIVDAKTVPSLYSGRVRFWHLALILLVGLLALAAAVASTPLGAQWADELSTATDSVIDWFQGLFS